MGKELLLEIGTEEIPAAFLPKALRDLEEIARGELAANRIRHGEIRTMGTPRRLFLTADGLAEQQEDQVIEKLGPAARVAFDEQGNPSRAAVGFARGQNLDIAELERVTTEKGEYLCATEEDPRRGDGGPPPGNPDEGHHRDPLPQIDALVRPGVPLCKTDPLDPRPFRRPDRPVPDRKCRKRQHQPRPPLYEPGLLPGRAAGKGYLTGTRDRFVIVDPAERKEIIREETRKAAAAVGGRVLPSEELLETVTFLTEYPTVVCGNFDREYLKLPKEVLITTMISHQKYFPVVDEEGALLPHFITINNTLARDPAVVKRGNEKVIRARLSDARFFFEADRKIPLDRRVADLKKVVFHTLLGTSHEKVMRFRKLAAWIADRVDPTLAGRVDRAALLAKTDLDTQMVGEFAELQGHHGARIRAAGRRGSRCGAGHP